MSTPIGSGIPSEGLPLPIDELLHALRGVQESEHFNRIQETSCSKWLLTPGNPRPIDFDNLSEMRLEDAVDAYNRTAPVYLLRDLPDPQESNTVRGTGWRSTASAGSVARFYVGPLVSPLSQRY